jgi:hypothetical protein
VSSGADHRALATPRPTEVEREEAWRAWLESQGKAPSSATYVLRNAAAEPKISQAAAVTLVNKYVASSQIAVNNVENVQISCDFVSKSRKIWRQPHRAPRQCRITSARGPHWDVLASK